MKTRILWLLALLVGFWANAQTITVGGVQTGVWDADTVLVVADVNVGDSLVVVPGTTVLFDGFYSITVSGEASFVAQGTKDDSIRFTVADTTGLSIYNSPKGGWNGFHLEKAGRFLLDYCVLEYAKASDTTDMSGGAMRIDLCEDVEISHSTLHYNRARVHGGAVSAENSHVVMTDCNVSDNKVFIDDNIYNRYGGALRFLKCDVELKVMEFLRNIGDGSIGGAIGFDSCAVVIDRSVFADNIGVNGGGLYLVRSNHLEGRLSNLLFENNISRHFGGGLAFADASPEVYNITVTRNSSEGVNCNGVFFYQECSPRLTNCIIYGNYPNTEMLGPADTIQMWLWTYNDFGPEFRNCLIEGGTKCITNPENIRAYEDIVETDPLFVDPENRDFRLSEESPCRDAGNAVVPEFLAEGFDLAGIRRVSNGRIDIGSYEYSAASVPVHFVSATNARLIGNPLNSESRIEFDHEMSGDMTVTVCSLDGRQVAQRIFELGKSTVLGIGGLVERLAPGVYLIEVSCGGETFTLKAVR